MSHHITVSITTGYRLNSQEIRVMFLAGIRWYSLLHSTQTGSGAHPASYPMDTGDSIPGGKVARV
jgi:hypothetical protein